MSNNIAASFPSDEATPGASGFQAISRAESPNEDALSLSDWIGIHETVSFQSQSDDQSGKSTTITFRLSGTASGCFSLLRGLIALGRPRTFIFQALLQTRNFSLKLEVGRESEVKIYLSRLFAIIDSEIRFKQVLRKVIVNQDKFEREERLLYNSL